jgi:hypothetical protein
MFGTISYRITWTKSDGTRDPQPQTFPIMGRDWGEIKERHRWGQKMQSGLYQLWEVLDDGFGSVTTRLMQGIQVGD